MAGTKESDKKQMDLPREVRLVTWTLELKGDGPGELMTERMIYQVPGTLSGAKEAFLAELRSRTGYTFSSLQEAEPYVQLLYSTGHAIPLSSLTFGSFSQPLTCRVTAPEFTGRRSSPSLMSSSRWRSP